MTTILVTGSRSEPDGLCRAVWVALDAAEPDFLILGDCPTGVDKFARMWAEDRSMRFKVHHADWLKHGKRAGPVRNSAMVAHGVEADARVLAFPRGPSPGTYDCIRKATALGLQVTLF